MTDAIRATASQRALLHCCSWWAQPGVAWDEASSAHATSGSEAHEGYEALHNGDPIALHEAARNKAEALRPVLEQLRALGSESWAELAFAYDIDTDTARVLGSGRDAYEKARPHEMCGTADLVVRRWDRSLVVADYKARTPGRDVDARAQLRTLALFAARALGSELVDTVTVLVDEASAEAVPDERLDCFDLDEEQASLNEDLRPAVATPHPGPHCRARYCKAIARCPATVEALAQTLPAEALVQRHRLSPTIADDQHAAWSLTAVDQVEAAVKVIRASLRAYADANGGIALADGSTWQGAEVTTERPALDVPGALDVVRRHGGEEAVTSSLTWAALERVVGKAEAKRVREELASMGAVKAWTFKRYEARKPRKSRAA